MKLQCFALGMVGIGFVILLVGVLLDGKRTKKRLDWHQMALRRKNPGG